MAREAGEGVIWLASSQSPNTWASCICRWNACATAVVIPMSSRAGIAPGGQTEAARGRDGSARGSHRRPVDSSPRREHADRIEAVVVGVVEGERRRAGLAEGG